MRTETSSKTQEENQATTDSFGQSLSRLKDETLAGNSPNRTWSEWATGAIRDVGFKAVLGVSSLGLGGAAVSEKQAEAGIISDFGVYENYRLRGFGKSVEGGGNEATNILSSELGVFPTGITMITPYKGIAAAHPFDLGFGLNRTLTVKTNANYNTGPLFTPSGVFIHPGYLGPNAGIDFAVITFDVPLPVQNNLVFAAQRAVIDEQILLVGAGITGSPNTGYVASNGDILAGFSRARTTPPILGGDPRFY